jgi:hypothetical protein
MEQWQENILMGEIKFNEGLHEVLLWKRVWNIARGI